jgi:hypothetical protein
MKNLLLLALLGVLGYFAYLQWEPDPEPPPPAPVLVDTAPQAPPGADERVYFRVRRMYDEWQNRALATDKLQQGSRRTDLSTMLTEIREILGGSHNLHSPEAVKEVIVYHLGQIGVPPGERDYVYAGLLSEASRDGQRGAHNSSQ